MIKVRLVTAHIMTLTLIFTFRATLYSETVRERANLHFMMNQWTVQAESLPHTAKNAAELPGGDETFVTLKATRAPGVDAIYPEAEGLGLIDYSGLPSGEYQVLDDIASGFMEKTVKTELCSADRPFLSTLSVYKLDKLPEIEQVLYSRAESLGPDLSSIRYRLTVTAGGTRKYVFLTVLVTGTDTAARIDDIIFDGLSYADAAQQN